MHSAPGQGRPQRRALGSGSARRSSGRQPTDFMDASHDQSSVPSGSLREDKKQLRALCRQRRDDLGEDYRQRASERICASIQEWPAFHSARIVFAYLPIKGEVDLRPLIGASPAATWAIPRIVHTPERRLAFHAYHPDRLIQHQYGMLEPDPASPEIDPGQADLIIVPGLAFTRSGYRLGYGGGYYDHLLATPRRAVTLGACYQALLVDDLPREPHDAPVGSLVTEAFGVLSCRDAG